MTTSTTTIWKKDDSPVTVADFAVQAVVLAKLKHLFPHDSFVAEEGGDVLLSSLGSDDDDDDNIGGGGDNYNGVVRGVMEAVRDGGFEDLIPDVSALIRAIDLGGNGNRSDIDRMEGDDDRKNDVDENLECNRRPRRVWCLDPIDGTRGFLRGARTGGQYCVALALIEDGLPVLGVLGCPNLPISHGENNKGDGNNGYEWSMDESNSNDPSGQRGCLFVASVGGGSYQLPLRPSTMNHSSPSHDDESVDGAIRIRSTTTVATNDDSGSSRKDVSYQPSPPTPIERARFCVGIERYSDPSGIITEIARSLHGSLLIDKDEKDMNGRSDGNVDEINGDIRYAKRMDGQVKYAVLARGEAEVYLRLPKEGYIEWMWDHAAGKVVLEESGGVQTDTEGKSIDFDRPIIPGEGFAKLNKKVTGIIASCGGEYQETILRLYHEARTKKALGEKEVE